MNPTHLLISTQIDGLEKNVLVPKSDALKILFFLPTKCSPQQDLFVHPIWQWHEKGTAQTKLVIFSRHLLNHSPEPWQDHPYASSCTMLSAPHGSWWPTVTHIPSTKQRCILQGKGTYHWSEVRCPLAEWLSKYPQHLKFHWNPAHWTHMTELIGYGSFPKWWVSPTNIGFSY